MPWLALMASHIGVSPEAGPVQGKPGSAWFRMARILLMGVLVASPLAFGSVQTWAWTSLAALSAFLLLLWAIGSVRQRGLVLFWSPLYLPVALFLLWGGVQSALHFTLDPIATREALLKLATDFLLFFLTGQLGVDASMRTWRQFGLAVTAFAFVLSVFSILQFLSSQGLIYWSVKADGWTFGPYVNHNHYAGLMEALIPIAMAYVLCRPWNHPGRVMLVFSASVPIVSLLLSGSRGGVICLLAEAVVLAAILGVRQTARSWPSRGTVGVLVILTALFLFFWLDPGEVSGRLATVVKLTRSGDVSMAQRQAVALDSLRMLRDHPWSGVGLGGFEIAYPQYQSFPSDFLWDHAHNDYAEALVESGLIGGALIVTALVMFFRFSFKGLAGRMGYPVGAIQLGAALGCCGLLVHSVFDFNLHVPANAAWFAVCAASATCVTQSCPGEVCRPGLSSGMA